MKFNFRLALIKSRQRGVYGVMFAVLLVPLIGAVGCAIDYARVIQYKNDLQNTVDEAALAGAAVLIDNSARTNATAVTVATNYFKRSILPTSLTLSAPSVVVDNTGNALLPNGNKAFTVVVSANATLANTLFSIFVPSAAVRVQGTAGQPLVNANLALGRPNSQACDANSESVYVIPKNADGTGYDYSAAALQALPESAFTQVGSSATLPVVTANQPLGVRLKNVTGGICGGTAGNPYGAPAGSTNYFYSSLIYNQMSPSELSNVPYPVVATYNFLTNSYTQLQITPINSTTTKTYSGTALDTGSYLGNANCALDSSVSPNPSISGFNGVYHYLCKPQYHQENGNSNVAGNCSLYIQTGVSASYVNGLTGSSPAPAGSAGQCYNSTQANAQYAAPTCSQISALANNGSAAAAVFWWNDGGGVGSDDYDYNDAYFAMNCSTSGGNSSGNTQVALVK
jgi:Flp pilus assembly protein TadG